MTPTAALIAPAVAGGMRRGSTNRTHPAPRDATLDIQHHRQAGWVNRYQNSARSDSTQGSAGRRSSVGFGVDLVDQLSQHRLPDRPFRRRPLAVLVVAGLRDGRIPDLSINRIVEATSSRTPRTRADRRAGRRPRPHLGRPTATHREWKLSGRCEGRCVTNPKRSDGSRHQLMYAEDPRAASTSCFLRMRIRHGSGSASVAS